MGGVQAGCRRFSQFVCNSIIEIGMPENKKRKYAGLETPIRLTDYADGSDNDEETIHNNNNDS